MPNEACSNQSVTQQWAGTAPHRIRTAASSRTAPTRSTGDRRHVHAAPSRRPAAPTNRAMCSDVDPGRPAAVEQLDVRRDGRRPPAGRSGPTAACSRTSPGGAPRRRQRPGEREPPHAWSARSPGRSGSGAGRPPAPAGRSARRGQQPRRRTGGLDAPSRAGRRARPARSRSQARQAQASVSPVNAEALGGSPGRGRAAGRPPPPRQRRPGRRVRARAATAVRFMSALRSCRGGGLTWSDSRDCLAGEEVGPAPLQRVAPAEQAGRTGRRRSRAGSGVEVARAPGQTVQPAAGPGRAQPPQRAAGAAAGARRSRSPACGSRAAGSAPGRTGASAGRRGRACGPAGRSASPKPISATMIPTCVSEANDRADLMSVCTLPAR